jgi:hypothetical protein
MKEISPVIIFAYKRLTSIKKVIAALQNCLLADQSDIFIFSDGPKSENEIQQVALVRDELSKITGFKSVTLNFSKEHKGLANSIIEGVTKVFEMYDSVIVLEDDIITSKNFLVFMNESLTHYKNNKKIFTISGYNVPMDNPVNYPYDVYFTLRSSSWGWGSWKDRWENIDWEVKEYDTFHKDKEQIKLFNKGGSDLFNMLKRQRSGKVDSWAIRWCFHQFKTNTYCIYPIVSKVKNIGFDNTASNSNSYNRYDALLDEGTNITFKFPENIEENKELLRKFSRFYGIKYRIIGRMRTFLRKK